MAIHIQTHGTSYFFEEIRGAKDAARLVINILEKIPSLQNRKIGIFDMPPTNGLPILIEKLQSYGAIVHLKDHHYNTNDLDIIRKCRSLLGKNARLVTREEHMSCISLVDPGEFANEIIIADKDRDGVLTAIKSAFPDIYRMYPEIDRDAAIFDGILTKRTRENLSGFGFKIHRAWASTFIPFVYYDKCIYETIIQAIIDAIHKDPYGFIELEKWSQRYEDSVENSLRISEKSCLIGPDMRFVEIPKNTIFDPVTLAIRIDGNVLVSARKIYSGAIANEFGSQISIARTEIGKSVVNFLEFLQRECLKLQSHTQSGKVQLICNSPFFAHFSPRVWEEIQSRLIGYLSKKSEVLHNSKRSNQKSTA